MRGSGPSGALVPQCVFLALLAALPGAAQQIPDASFDPPVAAPAFPSGTGPVVAIDAAHVNFHTMEGRYQTLAKLLLKDGYRVQSNRATFDETSLASVDVLVIANAMHTQSEAGFAPLPNLSAFSESEIAAVEQWVADGGSLFLIADHMPIAGHNEALAAAFGIRFHNGFVFDSTGGGLITFRRSDGTLGQVAWSRVTTNRHASTR